MLDLINNVLPAPVSGGFKMDGYWVWCGSVIKAEDGKYHMFASRWPNTMPMHPGWLVASEVVRAVSDTPEGPYQFKEVVLKPRGARYWDGRMTHNPQIVKHNNTYILYYTGSTHPYEDIEYHGKLTPEDHRVILARANKRVGIAVSKSITGPWKRMNTPILPTRPDCFDSFLTSNPAPCIKEDGSALLVYKSRGYKGRVHGPMILGVAYASNYLDETYNRPTTDKLFSIDKGEIEDPFIWKDAAGYNMIAKDMTGNICGEKHGGVYATSSDGFDWNIIQDYKSYSRSVLWDDGKTRVMGSLERPFILFEYDKPTHIFFATADGPGGFTKATKTWNMVIPLKQE